MRIEVQIHEHSLKRSKGELSRSSSSRKECISSEHLSNRTRSRDSFYSLSDSGSQSSPRGSATCSQHSGSENATESDLPGPGRSVGKFFSRLGHSLDLLVIKHTASKPPIRNSREVEFAPGGGYIYNTQSAVTLSDVSSVSDALSFDDFYGPPDDESPYISPLPDGSTFSLENRDSVVGVDFPPILEESRRSSLLSDSLTMSSVLVTCTLSRSLSTNATISDLSGPGRILGRGYATLGKFIERGINRLLAGRAPDVIAARLDTLLRKLLRVNFLLRYKDLEKAEMKGMESILGVLWRENHQTSTMEPIKGKSGKNKDLLSTVKLQIEQGCAMLLEHALNCSLHDMQVGALREILELASTYPIARDCFNSLGSREAIASLCLHPVVSIDVTIAGGSARWPAGYQRTLQDAARAVATLRDRCIVVLEENEVFRLWRDFFLAGDGYEREKIVMRLLTYLQNNELAFLAARMLTSILCRPFAGPDLSESAWTDIFSILSQLLERERVRQLHTDGIYSYRTPIEPDALDALVHAALERASHYLGKFTLGFIADEGALMAVVHGLKHYENSSFHYPNASEFALMLAPFRNRERMRRASA